MQDNPEFIDQELLKLTRALLPEQDRDNEQLATETLCRIIWSHITEPGDMYAGSLINELGALESLTAVFAASGRCNAKVSPAILTKVDTIRARFRQRSEEKMPEAWSSRLSRRGVYTALRIAEQHGIKVLTPQSTNWPTGFADLQAGAPHCLWTIGDISILGTESVGIVGSRAVTRYGEEVTGLFAEQAVAFNHTVVSGAAYGVDAIAHRTAIAAEGKTIAFVAGGVNRAYPRMHTELYRDIALHGAVASENPPDTTPARWRFLQRNRLIAAHAEAIVLTEAGIRSGAVNTAGHAAALDRPLGAVPGNITGASHAGCHRIIREYEAVPLFHQRELAELLPCMAGTLFEHGTQENPRLPATLAQIQGLHTRIKDALLPSNYRSVEQIITVAGVTKAEALETLAELTLLGEITQSIRTKDGQKCWKLASQEQ